MAKTKLKNLKIKKVDFVDDGANPVADIKLFKSKDGTGESSGDEEGKNPNFWKRLFGMIAKAAHTSDEGLQSAIDEIEKGGAVSFGEKFNETKNRKIADEIWDICYALQSSLYSILNDEEMDGTSASTAMQESLTEFTEVVSDAISQWSAGKSASIVKKETDITETELEMMKFNRDKMNEIIDKSVVVEGGKRPGTEKNILDVKGVTEMKINKSKLTSAERAFLEDIEKRCGEEDETGTGAGPEPEQTTPAVPTNGEVGKKNTATEPTSGTDSGESNDVYKGLHPAVKAEIEALRKFREDAEDKEVHEVAKRYAIIGKKEEELFPVLKSLKAAGGTAYNDMIAVLNQVVDTVEKSAAFTEIGKSGGAGTSDGAAWAKAEQQAMEIMKSKNVSKAQALDEVFRNNPELAKECEEEE